MSEEINSILEKYDQSKFETRYKEGKYYDSPDCNLNKLVEEHLKFVKSGEARNLFYKSKGDCILMKVDLYEFTLDGENNLTTKFKPNFHMSSDICLNKHNTISVVELLLKYREVVRNEGKGEK